MIKNNKYILIGIVHFIPPEVENGIGHYISFCKAVTKSWKQHDDLKCKANIISNESLTNILVRPAIIGFVKVSN